jgi:hypothetical protein
MCLCSTSLLVSMLLCMYDPAVASPGTTATAATGNQWHCCTTLLPHCCTTLLLLLLLQGANLPSLTRALVACAWFGIQTWIGGSSIHQMLVAVGGSSSNSMLGGAVISGLGITATQLACFLAFWALQVYG